MIKKSHIVLWLFLDLPWKTRRLPSLFKSYWQATGLCKQISKSTLRKFLFRST